MWSSANPWCVTALGRNDVHPIAPNYAGVFLRSAIQRLPACAITEMQHSLTVAMSKHTTFSTVTRGGRT
ncbi:hypothetical protein [Mycobacterium antarcticum]|uniref:hypothetical protein n=1 Tax=Mycolicibacterium sp. TUM20983 TaxID=3023369 RepID=UPI0024E08BB0|nr:hypothetical protein [Mycolicibacterium sp. TUM20983]